jgi:Zn-finger nucleic acid-binding protein
MLHETFGGVAVDLCPGCAGAWFDAFEFEKFDDSAEHVGSELMARIEALRADAAPVDTSVRLASPADPGVTMMRRFADPEGTIEIDECPATGGIWLDAGELGALRTRFPDAATRDEATRVVIERVMACPDFQAARAAEAAATSEAGGFGRVARMLGWLTPWRDAA